MIGNVGTQTTALRLSFVVALFLTYEFLASLVFRIMSMNRTGT